MLKLHVGQRVTYISWIIINIRATAHLPPPPLTQQQSTDDKLRLMLGKERGRLAVAQILILIPFHFLPSLAYERSPPLYTPPPPSIFCPLSSWVLFQWEFVICYLVIYIIRAFISAWSSPLDTTEQGNKLVNLCASSCIVVTVTGGCPREL